MYDIGGMVASASLAVNCLIKKVDEAGAAAENPKQQIDNAGKRRNRSKAVHFQLYHRVGKQQCGQHWDDGSVCNLHP